MSFMFNPHPYDDPTPVNTPKLAEGTEAKCTFSYKSSAEELAKIIRSNHGVYAIDGCPTAEFDRLEHTLNEILALTHTEVEFFHIADIYKSSEELERQFSENLPEDTVKDPVLLYGKLYKETYESVFEPKALEALKIKITSAKDQDTLILIGQGAASEEFWPYITYSVFIDVTPKVIMLRTIAGRYINLGDTKKRTLKMIQRRIYYIDLELAVHLRKNLITKQKLDFYITSDHDDTYAMLPIAQMDHILESLSKQPFRCKPVYIEGVWGGHYVRNVRKLPNVFKNIAWVFDLIPLEVSILIQVGSHTVDIPFYTFVQFKGRKIMGEKIFNDFGGYFPIRFNYDDTFHSNGNMSIQCHPAKEFCMSNFNELGTQDEGYYIVAVGHDAKTYCGFRNGVDVDEFITKIEESEKEKTEVDYKKYVNAVESVPGKQFLIPGGTIHASGRNQVILEIGSLTIGSYTFKLYDYLRKDLDGNPRPIHSNYGKQVLAHERDADFVNKRLLKGPVLLEKGDGWEEYLVGEDPLVYYSCRQIRFTNKCDGNTKDRFHVLSLVDGESVVVRSKSDPCRAYHLNYLDIVVVPQNIGEYEIVNQGSQPVIIHKVMVREE